MGTNIIIIDFEPNKNWTFRKSIEKVTNRKWKIKKCISNGNRFGKIDNLIRYIKYFVYTFHILVNREKYDSIIAWQQFNGIIFGFYSRLFRIKKNNKLFIMTFIYNPKRGLVGKLYKKFVKYSIDNNYVDKIICFSSSEPQFYAEQFAMDKEKFVYIPLGEDLQISSNKEKKLSTMDVISLGLSNRDYEFLVRVFNNLDYKLKIYADRNEDIAPNIQMVSEYLGNKVVEVMQSARILVIPLKDKNISSGQLTVLHAMQLGVPVIATDADGIRDFVIDGETGFLVENNENEWEKKIALLLSNNELYEAMSKNAINAYKGRNTVYKMAENIGNVIISEEV